MTKKIDTSEFMPADIRALGRSKIADIQSAKLNVSSYRTWFNHLFTVLLGSFEWEGLPPEIDPRFVEYVLSTGGVGGFFSLKDQTAQWAFAPAAPLGNLTMYYNPNKVVLTPVNGGLPWYRHAWYWLHGDVLYEPDCALCWDSLTRQSMLPTVRYYARRLAAIDRTIDTNMSVQQTPFILTTDQRSRGDAQRVMEMLTGHSQVLTVNQSFADAVSVDVLKTDAPYVADKLLQDQIKILNLYYSLCGVDNSNTEKRERVSDKEATSNNEQVMIVRKSRLRCRETFCQQVAHMTDGVFTPTVKYAVPYRDDGNVDMSYGGEGGYTNV